MRKKGQGFVNGVIFLVIAVIMVTLVAIPIINPSTSNTEATETAPVSATENQTYTLQEDNAVTGSLAITGLTLTNNYTVNYTSRVVSFVNGTTAGNYSLAYDYLASNYVTDATSRTLLRTVVIAMFVGLVVAGFSLIP